MKITKDIKKFKIDVIKAMDFMFADDAPLSLLNNIANTPSIGVKSKNDNNMFKKKYIKTSISYGMTMYQTDFKITPHKS
jgi:hypothetical protein